MNYSKIKVYSTATCPYCKMESAWLKSNKITFEEIHVDQNQEEARAMVEKTGQMGVPVTEIQYPDRKPEFVVGFNQMQLAYMLGV
jgi:glutaredoxin